MGSVPAHLSEKAGHWAARKHCSAQHLDRAIESHRMEFQSPEVGRRSPNMYWNRKRGGAQGGFASFGSLAGAGSAAVSACMPRFEAVLADAEDRGRRVVFMSGIKAARSRAAAMASSEG